MLLYSPALFRSSMIASTAFSPTPRTAHIPNRITPSVARDGETERRRDGVRAAFTPSLRLFVSSSLCTYTGVKSLSDTFTSVDTTYKPLYPSVNALRPHSSDHSTI